MKTILLWILLCVVVITLCISTLGVVGGLFSAGFILFSIFNNSPRSNTTGGEPRGDI